jgi:formylmethanofuran dehydrogenase subunit D
MHPEDLVALGVADGAWICVQTRTGELVVRAEADDSLRRGVVSLPHGYGQLYPDAEGRVVVGPRLNLLTASEDCDPIAATPYHKNVAVRLAAADAARSAAAEATSARIRAIAASPPAVPGLPASGASGGRAGTPGEPRPAWALP